MKHVAKFAKLRASEWVLVAFFAYVVAIGPFFRDRPNLHGQPAVILIAVFLLASALCGLEQTRWARLASILRDWIPISLTLAAFREMELFVPSHYEQHYVGLWVRQDHTLLSQWHMSAAIESLGKVIPVYLETSYLVVYGMASICVGVLYRLKMRRWVDRFWTVYLVGTLVAYGLFPYFPSQPPRIAFPGLDQPTVTSWIRDVNLAILQGGTIHSSVFPSAHVSSAFSASWAMFLVLRGRKLFAWGLLFYAASVSVATIYGRYHYSADVLGGFAVSLLAGAVCVWLRGRGAGEAG